MPSTGSPNVYDGVVQIDHFSLIGVDLLPMGHLRAAFQRDWDELYATLPEDKQVYYSGTIFEEEAVKPGDYPGVGETPTFAVPNGVLVRAADPGLVRFIAQALFTERAAFEKRLWGQELADRRGRSFPGPDLVSRSPLFCYVRPHDAAEDYYQGKAAEGGYTYLDQCFPDPGRRLR